MTTALPNNCPICDKAVSEYGAHACGTLIAKDGPTIEELDAYVERDGHAVCFALPQDDGSWVMWSRQRAVQDGEVGSRSGVWAQHAFYGPEFEKRKAVTAAAEEASAALDAPAS